MPRAARACDRQSPTGVSMNVIAVLLYITILLLGGFAVAAVAVAVMY